jgi:hypothetical protein
MGFGMDLEGIEDFELATMLNHASAVAEAYCAVPRLPRQYSFLGGAIIPEQPEQHFWRVPEAFYDPGSRRIYPYSWPIREVTRFRVRVTNTQYVDIQPSELFINNTERYVEVVSLLMTGVGLFGVIVPTIGLMQPVAEICYTYGFHFEAVDEIVYPTDARTYRAQNQYWLDVDPAETIVKINDVVQTTGFTIDRIEGTVTFDANLAASDRVMVSYEYKLPTEVRDAVGAIVSYLIGQRETRQRGMTDISSLKMGEVSIVRKARPAAIEASQLQTLVPEAAFLLDGFKNITAR